VTGYAVRSPRTRDGLHAGSTDSRGRQGFGTVHVFSGTPAATPRMGAVCTKAAQWVRGHREMSMVLTSTARGLTNQSRPEEVTKAALLPLANRGDLRAGSGLVIAYKGA